MTLYLYCFAHPLSTFPRRNLVECVPSTAATIPARCAALAFSLDVSVTPFRRTTPHPPSNLSARGGVTVEYGRPQLGTKAIRAALAAALGSATLGDKVRVPRLLMLEAEERSRASALRRIAKGRALHAADVRLRWGHAQNEG